MQNIAVPGDAPREAIAAGFGFGCIQAWCWPVLRIAADEDPTAELDSISVVSQSDLTKSSLFLRKRMRKRMRIERLPKDLMRIRNFVSRV